MSIKERIEEAGGLLKSITGFIALLPGIAVLIGIAPLPDSIAKTVGFLAVFTSIVVVTTVILLDRPIRASSDRRAAFFSVATLILGIVCVIGYVEFAQDHVVKIVAPADQESRFVVPTEPTAAILRYVDPVQPGRPTLTEYEETLQASIAPGELSGVLREATRRERVILIVLLLLSHTLLIASVMTAIWKLTGRSPEPGRTAPAAADPAGPLSGVSGSDVQA